MPRDSRRRSDHHLQPLFWGQRQLGICIHNLARVVAVGAAFFFPVMLSATTPTLYTAATASPVNFGSVNVGESSMAMTATFTFTGSTTLSQVAALSRGATNGDFQIVEQGTTCAAQAYVAGDNCVVEAIFSPVYPGPRPGAIVLYDNSTPERVVGTAYAYGLGVGPQGALVPGVITTVAGCLASCSGIGGPATQVQISAESVAVDGSGNLFLVNTDFINNMSDFILRVDANTGILTSYAGVFSTTGGTVCANQTDSVGDGCLATQAVVDTNSIALDGAGNLYLLDVAGFGPTFSSAVLRKIDRATGVITNLTPTAMSGTIGIGGIDESGDVYITQEIYSNGSGYTYNLLKYDSTTQQVTTFVSNLFQGDTETSGTGAALGSGAIDGKGNLLLAGYDGTVEVNLATAVASRPDAGHSFAAESQICSTGQDASLFSPILRLDAAGDEYYASPNSLAAAIVCEYDSQASAVFDIAGSGYLLNSANGNVPFNGDNIPATSANLGMVTDFQFDGQGNLYIADLGLGLVRKVTVTTGTPIAFPSTAAGSQSSPVDVAIENIGNMELPMSSFAVSANFTANDSQTTCSSGSQQISSGAVCTLGIEFAPESEGMLTGTVTITDESLNTSSTQQILLSGNAGGGSLVGTTTMLTASAASITAGTSVTFTATVKQSSGTSIPTGTITFLNGATTLGTGTLNASGVATFTTSTLAAGTYLVAASYGGDSNHSSSASASLSLTVTVPSAAAASLSPSTYTFASQTAGTTSTAASFTLSNSGNATLTSIAVTITGTNSADFTVATGANECGTTLATGASCNLYVTFTPATAASFSATLSVTDSAGGAPQTASLSGTGTAAPDFSVSVTPGTQSIAAGGSVNFKVTVVATGGYNQPISLSVEGIPSGATANFSSASLNPNGSSASATLVIRTQAAITTAARVHGWPTGFPALALFVLLPTARWRRRINRFVLLMLLTLGSLGSTIGLTGCGGGFALGRKASSYAITITGTNGNDTHSTTVQLTVD